MGWRRRVAWERRDWIALTVLAGSIALGVLLVSSTALRLGIRQGLLFLLVFVLIAAAGVLLVRHAPLPVLHFGQPVTLTLGGFIAAAVTDAPVRYLALGAAVLGAVQFVLQLRARRQQRGQSASGPEAEDTSAGTDSGPSSR